MRAAGKGSKTCRQRCFNTEHTHRCYGQHPAQLAAAQDADAGGAGQRARPVVGERGVTVSRRCGALCLARNSCRVAEAVRTTRWWVCHARGWAPRGCPAPLTQLHTARRHAAASLWQVSEAGRQPGDSTAQRLLCAAGRSWRREGAAAVFAQRREAWWPALVPTAE